MLPESIGRLARLLPKGRRIRAQSATATHQEIANALTRKKVLIRFGSGRSALFVVAGSSVIDNLEPGQAGGNGVLQSQKGTVIFYETIVNDVYAWYLTGRKTKNGIPPLYNPNDSTTYGYFPTTSADLKAIIAFATAQGAAPVPDPDALAMEAKLFRVDAFTVPNPKSYIITEAIVPVYDRSNSTDWSPAGTKQMTVALVGVHIVGSANGHREMLLATFEHQGNTPLATYQYNSGGKTVTVNQTRAGAGCSPPRARAGRSTPSWRAISPATAISWRRRARRSHPTTSCARGLGQRLQRHSQPGG